MTRHITRSMADTAVVIPCYRSAGSVKSVIEAIPPEIGLIICVNDASDDDLDQVLQSVAAYEPRLRIVTHERNGGVGAATVTGYRHAIAEGARVIVKIDSDGQMNPAFIPALAAPIRNGEADYTKGNRFFDIDMVRAMPGLRLVGNAGLSFLAKLSTGYWNLMDPTNGFTAIHADVAALLPLEKLHKRYFFESDILFRLRSVGARIIEQPMETRYGDETSHLSEWDALVRFPFLHARNFFKRVFYNYVLRSFNAASLSLIAGAALFVVGFVFGINAWIESSRTGIPATAGTVMLAALPLLIGFQLLLSFLQFDVAMIPQRPIHPRIAAYKALKTPETKNLETTT